MDIAIVADDLTGAADTAVMFARGGRRVEVALTLDAAPSADVLAIDTASRERSPAVGAYRVFKAVSAIAGVATPLWYKKLDSTLRGNVTSELDAFLRAAGGDGLVVAPAYPAQGRTTLDGVQHFDAAAMGGAQRHDVAPLLAPLGRPLLRLGLADVRRGSVAIGDRLACMPRSGIVLCDALTDGDLDQIAETVLERGGPRLALAGSAGLAAALHRCRCHDGPTSAPPLPGPCPVLLVIGTRNPVARRQLAFAESAWRMAAPALAPIGPFSPAPEARRSRIAEDHARTGRSTRGAIAGGAGNRSGSPPLADDGGVTILASPAEHRAGDPRDLARGLARDAAALVPRGHARLFITGGEAARAVLDELGVTRLVVRGAVADGMPALTALDGVPGLEAVTKAGGFGAEDALVRAAAYLRGAAP